MSSRMCSRLNAVPLCRTGEECFDTTGNVRDRLMCARADISSDSIEESRAACEYAGNCHYNTGWSVHREWYSINTGM